MKKYINKITKAVVIALVVFGAHSCGDAYLEEVQVYNIDSENYFNSESNLQMTGNRKYFILNLIIMMLL